MCLEGKDPKPCTATRRKQRVILMGESLLQGTEAPLCQPGLSCREVCCLPGAQVWDVVEGLLKLASPQPTTPCCYSLWAQTILLGETWRVSKVITELCGKVVKGLGAQVVLSSILLVRAKGVRRRAPIMQVNIWLWNWSWWQGFRSYNHGTLFADEPLLRRGGIALTKRGKVTFASRMADLVRRALK